jgi:hypothetical protein
VLGAGGEIGVTMVSDITIDSQIVRLRPLTCDMPVALMYPEAAFAQASIAISGEVCWHGFTLIVCCNSDSPRSYPDICTVVEAKAKSATAWPDCINEWNIRDP